MDSTFTNLEDLIKEAGLAIPVYKKEKVPVRRTRFLFVGTHAHQTTGYSKVSYNLLHELSKYPDIDIFHFGFQKFAIAPPTYRPYPPNVEVYDPAEKEKNKEYEQEMGFGFRQLPIYIQKVQPDFVMIYNDAGIVCKFLEKLPKSKDERPYTLMVYLDQVYTIQRPEFLTQIEMYADMYFAFTNYWKEVLLSQGIQKPVHVLRHGFDPTTFHPMDRLALRRKHKFPEHAFVLLNLNRNTPRKRHDLVVMAFAEMVARFPTKPLLLLLVCDGGESGGFPLREIFFRELARLNTPIQAHGQKLMLTTTAMTYTDELINEFYCMSDIGITGAEGEGFGLCQFEAMGVGIPQVVPYIGGFRDFCTKENSQCVQPTYRSYLALSQSSVGGISEIVDPHELALAAEEYLLDSELRAEHGKKAMETVLQYKWSDEVRSLANILLKHTA